MKSKIVLLLLIVFALGSKLLATHDFASIHKEELGEISNNDYSLRTLLSISRSINLIILSEAKIFNPLIHIPIEILRFAQNDKHLFISIFQIQLINITKTSSRNYIIKEPLIPIKTKLEKKINQKDKKFTLSKIIRKQHNADISFTIFRNPELKNIIDKLGLWRHCLF
ncbi:MAG: hypothetical protein FWG98_10865 [Candidatus Cloacimonetes bacterium]|nr:hypothetical protein [Candidatus Cloacimonadota bacterium]